jgi:V8-like Glu-specific endopeptidase
LVGGWLNAHVLSGSYADWGIRVTWRNRVRAGAAALGVLAVLGVLGVSTGTVSSVEALGAGQLRTTQLYPTAGTSFRAGGGASARAVGASGRVIDDYLGTDQIAITYEEPPIGGGSPAARREAAEYWTQQRMQAAASALPRRPVADGKPTATLTAAGRPSPDTTPAGVPTAGLFGGSPTIGALFYATGRNPRVCTAAVVDSTTGNLVVTAAHCIVGKGFASNLEYVPDYSDGRAPYGIWPVTAITVARGWKYGRNPNLDLAFVTVAEVHGRQIQATTGGLAMGFNLGYDQKIEVVAYNNGNTEPVRCATRSFRFRTGQLEYLCGGFHDGTSGAPWVAGYHPGDGVGTLVGVLGGYQGGGKYQWASYSPYFGSALRAVYQMAELRSAP